jgi:hypothetical protein
LADKGGPTTQAGIEYQNKIAAFFLGRMIDPGEIMLKSDSV